METLPFAIVLLSAFLHASWNAIARAAPEPGDALASGVVISGVVSIPILVIMGLPERASWPWLFGGVVINTIGIRLAMAAYRTASYGLAYPVMRAGIPLLTLPITAVLLAEWPAPAGVAGVLLIAAALIMLAIAARRAGASESRGLGYALLASLAGAGYVASDAMGVRLSGNVLGYTFMVAVGNGIAIVLLSAMEGKNLIAAIPKHGRRAALISVISMTSFTLYMYAVSVSSVALSAALRETSVLFAMVFARFALKEAVGPWHWAAAALAVAGVASIRLA